MLLLVPGRAPIVSNATVKSKGLFNKAFRVEAIRRVRIRDGGLGRADELASTIPGPWCAIRRPANTDVHDCSC
jgi:hypothetical protein